MLFNPLFIEKSSGSNGAAVAKNSKIAGASYLFNDIINVLSNNIPLNETKNLNGSSKSLSDNETIELNLLQTAEIDTENYKPGDVKKFIANLLNMLSDGESSVELNTADYKVPKENLENLLKSVISQIKFSKNDSKETDSEHISEAKIFQLLDDNKGVVIAVNQPNSVSSFQIVKEASGIVNSLLNDSEKVEYLVIYKAKELDSNEQNEQIGLTFAYTGKINPTVPNITETGKQEIDIEAGNKTDEKQKVAFYSYEKKESDTKILINQNYQFNPKLTNNSQQPNIEQPNSKSSVEDNNSLIDKNAVVTADNNKILVDEEKDLTTIVKDVNTKQNINIDNSGLKINKFNTVNDTSRKNEPIINVEENNKKTVVNSAIDRISKFLNVSDSEDKESIIDDLNKGKIVLEKTTLTNSEIKQNVKNSISEFSKETENIKTNVTTKENGEKVIEATLKQKVETNTNDTLKVVSGETPKEVSNINNGISVDELKSETKPSILTKDKETITVNNQIIENSNVKKSDQKIDEPLDPKILTENKTINTETENLSTKYVKSENVTANDSSVKNIQVNKNDVNNIPDDFNKRDILTDFVTAIDHNIENNVSKEATEQLSTKNNGLKISEFNNEKVDDKVINHVAENHSQDGIKTNSNEIKNSDILSAQIKPEESGESKIIIEPNLNSNAKESTTDKIENSNIKVLSDTTNAIDEVESSENIIISTNNVKTEKPIYEDFNKVVNNTIKTKQDDSVINTTKINTTVEINANEKPENKPDNLVLDAINKTIDADNGSKNIYSENSNNVKENITIKENGKNIEQLVKPENNSSGGKEKVAENFTTNETSRKSDSQSISTDNKPLMVEVEEKNIANSSSKIKLEQTDQLPIEKNKDEVVKNITENNKSTSANYVNDREVKKENVDIKLANTEKNNINSETKIPLERTSESLHDSDVSNRESKTQKSIDVTIENGFTKKVYVNDVELDNLQRDNSGSGKQKILTSDIIVDSQIVKEFTEASENQIDNSQPNPTVSKTDYSIDSKETNNVQNKQNIEPNVKANIDYSGANKPINEGKEPLLEKTVNINYSVTEDDTHVNEMIEEIPNEISKGVDKIQPQKNSIKSDFFDENKIPENTKNIVEGKTEESGTLKPLNSVDTKVGSEVKNELSETQSTTQNTEYNKTTVIIDLEDVDSVNDLNKVQSAVKGNEKSFENNNLHDLNNVSKENLSKNMSAINDESDIKKNVGVDNYKIEDKTNLKPELKAVSNDSPKKEISQVDETKKSNSISPEIPIIEGNDSDANIDGLQEPKIKTETPTINLNNEKNTSNILKSEEKINNNLTGDNSKTDLRSDTKNKISTDSESINFNKPIETNSEVAIKKGINTTDSNVIDLKEEKTRIPNDKVSVKESNEKITENFKTDNNKKSEKELANKPELNSNEINKKEANSNSLKAEKNITPTAEIKLTENAEEKIGIEKNKTINDSVNYSVEKENFESEKYNIKSKKVVTSFVLRPNKIVEKNNLKIDDNDKVLTTNSAKANISQVDENGHEIKQDKNILLNTSIPNPIKNKEVTVENGNVNKTQVLNELGKAEKSNTILEKTNVNSIENKSQKDVAVNVESINTLKSREDKEDKPISVKVKKTVKDVTEQKQEQLKTEVNVEHKDKKSTVTENINVEYNTEKSSSISESGKQSNTSSGFDMKEHKDTSNPINVKVGEADNLKSGKVFEETLVRTGNERNVKLTEVIKEVSRYLEKQDKSSMTLNIEPENMGKVKISVEVTDKIVRANITVETEVVKNMLESKLGDLQSNLNKNGNQQGMVNISLQNNEQKSNERQTGKRKMSGENKQVDKIEAETEEIKKSLGYNTVEYLA